MSHPDLLHVETDGLPQGPGVETFLLIHGYGASSFTWRFWTGALAERGHVVLVDLKGFGSSPKPDDGRYGPEEQAKLLHRLVLLRDLSHVTVVGHSLGGGVALLLALRLHEEQPRRIERLVVVSGAAYSQPMPPFVSLARRRRASDTLMRLLGARLVVRSVLRQIVHDPERITGSMVEGYADPLESAEARRALILAALQIVPPDLDAINRRFPELDMPALLLWGRQDPVVPLWVGERLAAELPAARLHVLERCGHIPPEEHPVASLEVVMRFLDETGTTSGTAKSSPGGER